MIFRGGLTRPPATIYEPGEYISEAVYGVVCDFRAYGKHGDYYNRLAGNVKEKISVSTDYTVSVCPQIAPYSEKVEEGLRTPFRAPV
jgi:hypothetical protein